MVLKLSITILDLGYWKESGVRVYIPALCWKSSESSVHMWGATWMSRAHEMARKWLQVFGLGPKLGRVQVWQILIKYCSFEPSFLPVLASHTTLLCSVLQFRNHSFWGREGGGRGGVGVSGGGHNNISDLFCMLDMLHLNFLKSWQVLGVKVRIFFLFIQTFLGKQKFNLFWAQTTSKSIFKQVGKGAKGQEEVGWANVAKKL